MGKNKQQVATEARASKKTDVQPQPAAEQPKATLSRVEQAGIDGSNPYRPGAQTPAPATPAPAQPATVSKQQMTIMELTVAFREQRQIEVKPSMLTQDGKYINLLIGKEWPVIQIGASGGIVLPVIKSYPKAFEAALQGDKLLAKQNEREAKKTAAPTAPAPKAASAEKQSVSA